MSLRCCGYLVTILVPPIDGSVNNILFDSCVVVVAMILENYELKF